MVLTPSLLHLTPLYQLGEHSKKGECDNMVRDSRSEAGAQKRLRRDGTEGNRNETSCAAGMLESQGQCVLRGHSQER